MRVLVIGDFHGHSDEGMRQITKVIADGVQQKHFVMRSNARTSILLSTIRAAQRFSPSIVHYVPGPTLRSFLSLYFYKRLLPDCITISSAIRPFFNRITFPLIGILKPDLVLTQDPRWEAVFINQGVNTRFLPNGIDLKRFCLGTSKLKSDLRMKYHLPLNRKLILHVGHICSNRNIKLLISLQRTSEYQVVVVASTALRIKLSLMQELENAGCIVISGFQSHIEEIYASSDYYLFPVIPTEGEQLPEDYHEVGVIDTPLSILEAMAINLPVVTTRFPALQRSLGQISEDDCFRWFDGSLEDCISQLNKIKPGNSANRQKVQHLSLSEVLTQLDAVYCQLVASKVSKSSSTNQ